MSVVIRGMEMPNNCEECPFCQWSNYYQMYVCFDENRYTEMFFDGKHPTESALRSRRADNCPMSELPPHGRLIDADSLYELCDIMADKCGIGESIWHQFRATVEQTHTIIEAEEG